MIKDWYEEYIRSRIRGAFIEVDREFIIYKGFKITKAGDDYKIQDVRRSDLYDPVLPKDEKLFKEHGFIKGADLIMCRKDERRSRYHKKKIESFYKQRKKFEEELPETDRLKFVEKKIRNINRNIHEHANEMFFYNSRVEQVKLKYSK